ncbi:MAG: universal stress protein [Flavobacteriales bacterium]|nr:universal stress protein [Flavobacteriales bacterium]
MDYTFKKILLAYDHSGASKVALEKALYTCKAFNTGLTIVNIKNAKSTDEDFRSEVETILKNSGVAYEYVERSGNVSKEISILEREIGADLIFMGSHGVQGFQPYWIGSNAYRVVSASSCPVITIQEDSASADFSNILLPLDNSIETRQKVPYCVIFAKAFKATVHILSVSKDSSEETTMKITAYANQTANYLNERGIPNTFDIIQGQSVPQTCIDYAKEKKAGLIMMMTETESASWFMGTYAQQLINHSPIPILSIHSRDLLLMDAAGY